jgi:hypothetical protein
LDGPYIDNKKIDNKKILFSLSSVSSNSLALRDIDNQPLNTLVGRYIEKIKIHEKI